MIVLPQAEEKPQHGFTSTTQVYYASMPSPRLNSVGHQGSGEADVDGLAQRLNADLTIYEAPPAYDEAATGVQDASFFDDVPDSGRDNAHRDPFTPRDATFVPVPKPRSLDSQGTSGAGRRAPTFQPLVLHSRSKKLEDGFFSMLPPTDVQPHPFIERDIRESDWTKFLSDLQTSARLSPPSTSTDRPSFFKSMGSILKSISATAAGKQPDQGNHRGPAALVDTWNENFFSRRGLDVVLAKGPRRLNGDRTLLPPDSSPSDGSINPWRDSSWLTTNTVLAPRRQAVPMRPVMPVPFTNNPHAQVIRNNRRRLARSVSSFSSCSSLDLDSDSDSDSEHEDPHPHPSSGPSPYSRDHPRSSTKAERRASRRARRSERRARRAERRLLKRKRRQERHFTRYICKAGRWEEKMVRKGLDVARGGYRVGMESHWLAFALAIPALMGKEDDGYYRLVVTERV